MTRLPLGMRDERARRAAMVAGLFVGVFVVRFVIERPTYIGTSFLFVLPVVLAALWFGVRGALVVSLSAAICFFIVERWTRQSRSSSTRWCGRRLRALVGWRSRAS